MNYGSIWNGCIGAWCPSLGMSGWSLIDQSPYKLHAGINSSSSISSIIKSDDGGRYLEFNEDGYAQSQIGKLLNGATEASLSVWHKMESGPTTLCATGFAVGDWYRFNLLWYQGATVYVQVENGYYNYPYTSFTSPYWTHFLMTYSASDDVRLYINGRETSLTPVASPPSSLASDLGAFEIGRQASSGNLQIGKSDDIRLWRRCLLPSEAVTLASKRGVGYFSRRRPITGRRRLRVGDLSLNALYAKNPYSFA